MNGDKAFDHGNGLEIAIIGMAGRFPGAGDVDEYWRNLRNGVESLTFFSEEELISSGTDLSLLRNPDYVKVKGVLKNADLFDAPFFGFTPREAEITDPQHRIFLECSWEALESAGYDPERYLGLIGVYGGVGENSYFLNNLYLNRTIMESIGHFQLMIGNSNDFVTTRVSYKLNLRGPSVAVQTACSTSLVAVYMACQSLLSGECDIALAGACSVSSPLNTGYLYQSGGIQSPDGHCRAFDAKAQGTVFSNGVGVVALKRLEEAIADRDRILAVIKGAAVNNDGSFKVGFTAPSSDGQAKVVKAAHHMAEILPETINYIETHGTATALGDPIEIEALAKAFRTGTEKKGFCAIGSVKTNIGHTDTAAGIAGLIKVVLSLGHEMLPPSIHFKEPNPEINFDNSPFYVNSILSDWKKTESPRRAGVSSFGIGGTNAHVILEEAPEFGPSSYSRQWQLLVLSAKTDSALAAMTRNLVEYISRNKEINFADVAYTLKVGRKRFSRRRFVVCKDRDDAISVLNSIDPKRVYDTVQEAKDRPVVFMFPGQGSQYVNMARDLFLFEPAFRAQVDQCAELLKPYLGSDIRDVIYPDEKSVAEATLRLEQTAFTQPALFVIEYSLAKLLESFGLRPMAMIGHSIGEYVAACLAGVFSLEEALLLVAKRGQLIQSVPGGAMIAVTLSEKDVQPLLSEELSLAAVNGPTMCVLSGPEEAVEKAEKRAFEKGGNCIRLHTSHAFHSRMMETVLPSFIMHVRQIKLNPPKIKYISNVTGQWITPEQVMNPEYWTTHLRQTVRFADGMVELLKDDEAILLEIGPGRTLAGLVQKLGNKASSKEAFSSLRHPKAQESDLPFLLKTLGLIWAAGTNVNWNGFYGKEKRHRISLPTYPFERQRYWIEPIGRAIKQLSNTVELPEIDDQTSKHPRPSISTRYQSPRNKIEEDIAKVWQTLLGFQKVGVFDNYFDIGGDSLSASQIISRLRDVFGIEIPIDEFFEKPFVSAIADYILKTRSLRENILQGAREKRPGYLEI